MRRTEVQQLAISFAAIVISSVSVWAQQPVKSDASAADETAIRDNVRQMEAGWNAKDGNLFAKPFAINSDYVVINGTHVQGHDRIARGHQEVFQTFLKDSTLSLSVTHVRFLRPDVAVVHVSGHLKTGKREATTKNDIIISLVMTREGNDWKIVAFQNTEVRSKR